jgi:hypothetical protein
VTTLALLVHDRYSGLVAAVDDRLVDDRRLFAAFAVALAVTPFALVAIPFVVA